MRHLTSDAALPLDTDAMPWIPTGPGKSSARCGEHGVHPAGQILG